MRRSKVSHRCKAEGTNDFIRVGCGINYQRTQKQSENDRITDNAELGCLKAVVYHLRVTPSARTLGKGVPFPCNLVSLGRRTPRAVADVGSD